MHFIVSYKSQDPLPPTAMMGFVCLFLFVLLSQTVWAQLGLAPQTAVGQRQVLPQASGDLRADAYMCTCGEASFLPEMGRVLPPHAVQHLALPSRVGAD